MPPKVSWQTAVVYSLGAIGSAAKSVPLTTILMLYYNQVIGLSAVTVSSVLMVSLILDAMFDPAIGHVSDNCRSRWGRRLPFMYASVLPVSVLFVMLWLPPSGWPGWALAIYLGTCVIGIRFFDTFFELPHAALIPELTSDYNERTRLFTYRMLFESVGGIAIMGLAYNVFMKENPDGSGGLLSRQGYPAFAWFTGSLIMITLLGCSLALHRRLVRQTPPAPRKITVSGHLQEIAKTLGNWSVGVLATAAVFIAIGSGIGSVLNIYWLIYFYKFTQFQMTMLALPVMLGMLLTVTTPITAKRLGKRNAAIALLWLYGLVASVPLLARLLDVIPSASPLLFAMVAVQSALGAATMAMVLIMIASMISDLVEEAEVRTGRRSEGLLLAANNLVRKAMQGLGTLGAGLILWAVSFPQGVERADVPMDVMLHMGWLYLAVGLTLIILATGALRFYRYDRSNHEANLRVLEARASHTSVEALPDLGPTEEGAVTR
jgi:glycoside/pentoside/hexuronide:cation symporter, GPH family